MGRALLRLKRRKRVLRRLEEIYDKAEHVLVIHYSCESFYSGLNGRTPRITSIAVRNLDSGQTESFSIHKIAEQKKVASEKIVLEYDELEKAMLGEFFKFVEAHRGYSWVHWHMRDMNYGFQAIEHRYAVLDGEPVKIDEPHKFDFARALISIYGCRYASHRRLENLLKMNHIHNDAFLTGGEEAKAFEDKDYVKLHQSTLAKTDMIANVFGRAVEGTLKTNAKWKEIYGFNPVAIGEFIKENWFFSIFAFVGMIIGWILNYIF